jgi:hypothetical protein
MKKQIITSVLALALIIPFACKKKDTTTPDPATSTTNTTGGGTTTGGTSSFVWQENGGSTLTADSAYWSFGPAFTFIKAYKSGNANYFNIRWGGGNMVGVGTSTLVGLPTPGFNFTKSSVTYSNTTNQFLNIIESNTVTTNAYNDISGSFNVAVSGGTISTISGTFTALSHKY